MNPSYTKKIKYKTFIFILLCSLYLVIPFNIYTNRTLSLVNIIDLLLLFYLVWLLLSVTLTINIIITKILISILVILNAFFYYIEYFFSIDINLSIITAIFQTNKYEALEQISQIKGYSIIYIIAFLVIPLLLIWKVHINRIHIKIFSRYLIIFIICCILSIIPNIQRVTQDVDASSSRFNFIKLLFIPAINYYPTHYIYNITKYFSLVSGSFTYKDIIINNKFKLNNKQSMNIVLVIGETARNKSFSLGGYTRNTNPELSKFSNLVYYKNFYSCNTGTVLSVSCLLSLDTGEDFRRDIENKLAHNITSFIPIFNYLDFDTFYITINAFRPNDPIFQRVKDAKNIVYMTYSMGYRDDNLIPKLKQIINTNKKNKLIILHTMGSHYKYSARYPKEFKKWNPVCDPLSIKPCEKQYLINEYDNSILYTDYVLSRLINTLTNSSSMLLYTSDHGEYLGENNHYNHGGNYNTAGKEIKNIPTFIWFSNKWLKNFGNKQLINARNKQNEILNHDFISHSLLDCAFITSSSSTKTNIISKDLSLCSNSKPRKTKN